MVTALRSRDWIWKPRLRLCDFTLADLLHGFDQLFACVPFLVTFVEQLRADDAFIVHDKSRGVRNAGKTSGRLLIANAVGVNRLAPVIGEKQESDLMLRRGAFQHFRRIVANAGQRDPGRLDFLQVRLQLN